MPRLRHPLYLMYVYLKSVSLSIRQITGKITDTYLNIHPDCNLNRLIEN